VIGHEYELAHLPRAELDCEAEHQRRGAQARSRRLFRLSDCRALRGGKARTHVRRLQSFAAQQARSLITVTVLVGWLVSVNPAAAAGPPTPATGSFVPTSFEQSNIRSADGVTLFDFTEHDTISGTFTGTGVFHGSCVVRASGHGVCKAFETFSGTVGGRTGTLQFRDVIFLDPSGASHGTFTIVGGGSLANVHGHGTFQRSGTTGTYTGRLVLAP
jgi:hypothetical protein